MGFVFTLRPIYFSFASLAIGLIFAFSATAAEASVDTDGDGFTDAVEVRHGYDPRDPRPVKSQKRIEIDLKKQELAYFRGATELGRHKISSGKKGWTTPKGEYKILNKSPRAWSKLAGLWMPYWMGFTPQGHGIHELPVWPGGKREGSDHLGRPVSHGCVRLGVGPAQALYEWASLGTKVVVK